ncbi:putative ribonuclease H-like domain-containing protein [Tanacetum coccineum]|uniref:Ribonuclease H-like domain-containing protein n=1 Tax=Tanacetum coccineum TaxID=301880 RepID=A0ABQ4Z3X3_9ASTR
MAKNINTGLDAEDEINTGRVETNTGSGLYLAIGNWGSAIKTSSGYNWRSTRPNSNCNSGPTFIRTVITKGPQGRPKPVQAWQRLITGLNGKNKTLVILDFDSVSFVKELGHFNLFSILQICDKQHKVLFTETECLVVSSDFKMPDENQILLKVPRHHNMYSFDMKTPTPAKSFACLIAKATSDESKMWHRRLGHINFKNLNKLVKGNLVRGLPSKVFRNDHTCVACHKGKQHRASCKAKLERLITEPLHTLHMDLFGPTSVKSINHASYCLVITDDCTRFSWVFFLASKDETSGILQNFIRQIENQLNHRVKIIRSDNGTEFKNRDMLEFCGNKGIKQEYSNAKLHKQMELLKDSKTGPYLRLARTNDSRLTLSQHTFWGRAVSYCLLGTSQTPNANASEEKDEDAELIVVPSAVKNTVEKVETRKSSTNSKKEEILTEPQQEKEASSTGTSEDNPKILALERGNLFNTGELDPDDSPMPELKIFHKSETGIFDEASYDEEGVVTDFNSLPTEIEVSPTPTLRIHNIHPKSQILGDPKSAVQTRSKEEPKKISEALQDDSWVQAMQEELLQFKLARMELSDEEVYVSLTSGFVDPDHPKKVSKCGQSFIMDLLQGPRACLDLSFPLAEFINFSKLIFDWHGGNLNAKQKFLMYPCYLQMILDIQTKNKHPYLAVTLTKKIFGNMKRGFRGVPRPLLPAMLSIVAPSAGQEAPSVTQPQPSSSVIPPTPPTTQPIPSEATTIPPLSQPAPPTPIAETTTASPSPSPSPAHEPMEHTFEQPSTDQQPPTPRQAATTSQLMTRIGDLEKQLKETKHTFGNAILTLVDSVGKIDCNRLNTGSITVKSSSNTRVSTSHSDEESNMKMHQLLVAAPKQTTTVLPQTISISNIKLHNSEKEEYDYMGYGDGEHYLEYKISKGEVMNFT